MEDERQPLPGEATPWGRGTGRAPAGSSWVGVSVEVGVSAEVPVPMEVLVLMEEPSEVELKGPVSQSGEDSSSPPSAATTASVSVEPSDGLWRQEGEEGPVPGRGSAGPPLLLPTTAVSPGWCCCGAGW